MYIVASNDLEGILLVIRLVNGFFRTPKINALHRLINHYNSSGHNIAILPLDTSPLSSNSWLSGFIDADGHFGIRYTKADKYPARIACSFELEQRQNDISGESLHASHLLPVVLG